MHYKKLIACARILDETAIPLPVTATASLLIHPSQRGSPVRSISACVVRHQDDTLAFAFRCEARMTEMAIPSPRRAGHADGLWRHTCCEAFLTVPGSKAYHEFNFSPSGEWAHYAFTDIRCRNPDVPSLPCPPMVRFCQDGQGFELSAEVPAANLSFAHGQVLLLGIAAVIEDFAGQCTHWALTHAGAAPDFHCRQTFLLELT